MLTTLRSLLGPVVHGRVLQHSAALAVLTALAWPLFISHFDRRALWSSHEGRAGQNAQRMLDTGRWAMPTPYTGEPDHEKPPLYYWLVAAAAKLRGGQVDAWAVRLPAVVSALVGVWLVYGLGSVLSRPAGGFVSALMLAANLRYSWLARVGRIDMPLALAITAALASFWLAYRRILATERPARAWRWMLPAYLAAAAAMLLKGPIGVLLPALAVFVFLAVERQPVWPWQRGFGLLLHRLGAWWGVPLTVLIAAPWFVWAEITSGGEFLKTFLLHHHWNRSLGVEGLKPEPIWYYAPRLLVDFFPWSLLIPAAVWCGRGSRDSAQRFSLSWTLTMFAVLSLVRFKRADYLLPLVPGAALLVGGYWQRLAASGAAVTGWRSARLMAWTVAGVAAVAAGIVLAARDPAVVERWLQSRVVAEWLHNTDRTLLRHLLPALADGPASLIMIATVLAASLGGVAALRSRRVITGVTLVAACWSAAFGFYVERVQPRLEPLREQHSLAEFARRLQPAAAPLYYGRLDQQLLFYLGPRTRWLPDRAALRREFERAEPVFAVIELSRFLARRAEWPDLTMVPLARNTDNAFGTHRDPCVLVTNAAGRRLVETRRAEVPGRAN